MCGIAGFMGAFSEDILRTMNNVQAHRGPDDEGHFYDEKARIGLAHRRLSIIDISHSGHQPMWDASKKAVIVFNGEIYNYKDLREGLVKEGFSFKSNSDTEVILNLYHRYGTQCLKKLNGIFAFALWDIDCKHLFVARDGFGIKPLYFSETKNGFLFASELKAILKAPGVDKSIDTKAVSYYLAYLYSPSPHTMLKAVCKLPPGYAILVQDCRIVKKWQFYDLPTNQSFEKIGIVEAIDGVRHYISQAVERQMVADVEVGAFLSGGLDSSAIASFAQKFNGNKNLKCFTIEIQNSELQSEGFANDLPYAEKVAKHLDLDLHTVRVGPEMAERFEDMIYHLDEPQADPAALNVLFISQLAREHGIKVLLSGAGGDDIFSGYRRHYALTMERWWSWLPKYIRLGLSNASQRLSIQSAIGRRLSKAFRFAHLEGNERTASYFLWLRHSQIIDLSGPALRDSLINYNPTQAYIDALESLPSSVSDLNRMLYLDTKYFLTDHNLNYTDKMSMATGVEVRVPLLDPDLVAFAARLPIHYKQHGSTGKWIFKKAMEGMLPRDVIYRPKSGFGVPLRSWLKHELRDLVEDTLSDTSLNRRGLFDPKGVSQLVAQDRSGQIDAAYPILALVCIELWLRRFIDPTPSI